jgi:AraC-like DNA-binding protein
MSYFPKYLKEYPNMHSAFPFHISKNTLKDGYPAHRQDFLEFSYVIEGTGTETINGLVHRMQPGTFTFVLPYQIHEITTDAGSPLVLFNCMFGMDLLAEQHDTGLQSLLQGKAELASFVLFEDEEVAWMKRGAEQLYAEYSGEGLWRKALLKVKLYELLIHFDRKRKQQYPLVTVVSTDRKPKDMTHIVHYIHANYQEELRLSVLAAQFGMSQSHLSESIKKTTGQTFLHLLHDIRIRHACSLLVSTDRNVSDIALEVGYGSYKTFTRIFRETKGVIPTVYRRKRDTS